MARALSSIMVAVIVILALPVSQLRLVVERAACCCPDPAKCKCADASHAPDGAPLMKACRSERRDAVPGSTAPAFAPPPAVSVPRPAVHVAAAFYPLRLPHESPSPDRPPGPS